MGQARHVARVVIIDAEGSVLLCKYSEPRSGTQVAYWVPPGGALKPGEDHRTAALREVREETGLSVRLGRELRERRVRLRIRGRPVRQVERYFLARLDSVHPAVRDSSGEDMEELRWWSLTELAASTELVYPEGLRDELAEILGEGRERGAV